MTILFRYYFKSLASYVGVILMLLIGVVWLTQSLKLVNLITSRGIDFLSFLKIAAMLIVPLTYLVLPVAFFIGVMLFLHNISQDRELVVLRASGMSNRQIAKPIFILAIIFTIINYSLSFYFLPKSYREFKDMQELFKNKYLALFLEEGIFNTQVKNLTVYIDSKDSEGQFNGIFIYDGRNPQKPITIMADSGVIKKTNIGPEFVLKNGTHQEENKKTGHVSMALFDKYSFNMSNFTDSNANSRAYDANELYINQLLAPQADEKAASEFFVQANQRLLWPAYVLVLGILSSAVMMSGVYNRRQMWEKNIHTVIACALPLVLSITFNNMALRNANLGFLMHFNVLFFFLIALLLFKNPHLFSFLGKIVKKT